MNSNIRKSYFMRPVLGITVRVLSALVPGRSRRHKFRDWAALKVEYFLEYKHHLRLKNLTLAEQGGAFSVLVVLSALSVTGVPVAVLCALKAILKNGGKPLVISSYGGGLAPELEKLGINIIISDFYHHYPPAIKGMAENFDVIFVNTLPMNAWLNVLPKTDNVIWYLHEAMDIPLEVERRPDIGKALERCRHLYVVSEHAASFVTPYNPPNILHLGVQDQTHRLKPRKHANPKLRLATVGTIFKRKGQDLVIEALSRMDRHIKSQMEFIFLGTPAGKDGHDLINDCPPGLPLTFMPEIKDQNEKWDFYNSVDVFCVPSRDESCSMVLLEACMLGKPVIISDKVGAKYLVEEGRNGLIFSSEDIADLQRAITWIITHKERCAEMGRESRAIYLERARSELFEENLMAALKTALKNNEVFTKSKKYTE